MKKIEQELKSGFTSFYHFSLSLIESLSEKNGHLKFAVVNMQIALELFLKYYFIKKDMAERVFYESKGKRKFRDFSEVLNSYYIVVRRGHFAQKEHLKTILESRNNIVHKGKFEEWDEELASYIISCAFFIQGTLKKEFSETLIVSEYHPHNLSNNWIWKEGAENFAKNITSHFNEIAMECPHCYSRALVDKEIFDFDEAGSINGLQCLACFVEVETEINGKLIHCCACDKKSYYVDILNEQRNQIYLGGCFNCGNTMDLRCCANCDKLYFPDMINSEVYYDVKYFCSNDCCEMYKER